MGKIVLRHSDLFCAKDPKTAYFVERGTLLVYLVPYRDQKPGRRLFLYQGGAGDTVPPFCFSGEEGESWMFVFSVLEETVLREEDLSEDGEKTEQIKRAFAKKAGIPLEDCSEFEEQVIERYNISRIKEEGGLYATSLEQEKTGRAGLQLIESMFRTKGKKEKPDGSGNDCYDSVSEICSYLKIPVASYETIKEKRKRKITVEDIAELSHFMYREVVLEDGWYKKDGGPILAYRENTPIACIPKGPGKYLAFDPRSKEGVPITRSYANSLAIRGIMIYRPLREETVTKRDLARFCLNCVYRQDLLCLLLMTLLGTGIGLLLPVLNRYLFDSLIPMSQTAALIQICLLAIGCELGYVCFSLAKNFALFRSINGIKYAVQNAVYDRLFCMPEHCFREYESADLAQRAMGISTVFQDLADEGIQAALDGFFRCCFS